MQIRLLDASKKKTKYVQTCYALRYKKINDMMNDNILSKVNV